MNNDIRQSISALELLNNSSETLEETIVRLGPEGLYENLKNLPENTVDILEAYVNDLDEDISLKSMASGVINSLRDLLSGKSLTRWKAKAELASDARTLQNLWIRYLTRFAQDANDRTWRAFLKYEFKLPDEVVKKIRTNPDFDGENIKNVRSVAGNLSRQLHDIAELFDKEPATSSSPEPKPAASEKPAPKASSSKKAPSARLDSITPYIRAAGLTADQIRKYAPAAVKLDNPTDALKDSGSVEVLAKIGWAYLKSRT